MKHFKQIIKRRWLLMLVLSVASIVLTGCEKGSLGVKGGTIVGSVIDDNTNHPIPEVLVAAESTTSHKVVSTYTKGDGSYTLNDLEEDSWEISVEKYGYNLVGGDASAAAQISTFNGATTNASVIKMAKTQVLYKGVLKGYPIDSITGRPIRNFTVSQIEPYNQRKSHLFETAEDFRDIGWTGLEGGDHHYTISCKNYTEYTTKSGADSPSISIGASPVDLGVIKMSPLTVSISGSLRNLPGYVLDSNPRDILVWAESAGRVVATYTDSSVAGAFKGSVAYMLSDIPVTAGAVSVKCKVRGYDVVTINSSVSLPSTIPGGVVGGIDADFATIDPIKRDLRVVVTGSAPSPEQPSTFEPGETARIYVKQGGKDIVPYVDVVGVNYRAEGYISGVITGYNIEVLVVNMSRGYNKKLSAPFIVQEDGNSAFTIQVDL